MLFAELNVFAILGNLMYLILALIALWGAFCVVMVWNRVREKRFRNEEDQKEFLEVLDEPLSRGDFDGAGDMLEGDRRAMSQLALLAIVNRDIGYSRVRQLLVDRFQRDVLADLEYRLSWVNTVIKSAPMIGLSGYGHGHDGGLQDPGDPGERQAGSIGRRYQFCVDDHRLRTGDCHSAAAGHGQHQCADSQDGRPGGRRTDPFPGIFPHRPGRGSSAWQVSDGRSTPHHLRRRSAFPDEAATESFVRPRRREDAEMDITPMIDIVFLLLIFFLVASKMDEAAAVRLAARPARRRGGGRQLRLS